METAKVPQNPQYIPPIVSHSSFWLMFEKTAKKLCFFAKILSGVGCFSLIVQEAKIRKYGKLYIRNPQLFSFPLVYVYHFIWSRNIAMQNKHLWEVTFEIQFVFIIIPGLSKSLFWKVRCQDHVTNFDHSRLISLAYFLHRHCLQLKFVTALQQIHSPYERSGKKSFIFERYKMPSILDPAQLLVALLK